MGNELSAFRAFCVGCKKYHDFLGDYSGKHYSCPENKMAPVLYKDGYAMLIFTYPRKCEGNEEGGHYVCCRTQICFGCGKQVTTDCHASYKKAFMRLMDKHDIEGNTGDRLLYTFPEEYRAARKAAYVRYREAVRGELEMVYSAKLADMIIERAFFRVPSQ
jgi:hypothetical protein